MYTQRDMRYLPTNTEYKHAIGPTTLCMHAHTHTCIYIQPEYRGTKKKTRKQNKRTTKQKKTKKQHQQQHQQPHNNISNQKLNTHSAIKQANRTIEFIRIYTKCTELLTATTATTK